MVAVIISEQNLTDVFRNPVGGARIRTEKYSKAMTYSDAFAFVSTFYTDKTKSAVASESYRSGKSDPGKPEASVHRHLL